MTMIHLRSAQHPFTTPRLAFKAARVLAVAESIGVWRPSEPVVQLDEQTFGAALEAVTKADVATKAPFEFSLKMDEPPENLERLLDRVYDELHTSPVPEYELPVLEPIFGVEGLADLLGVGTTSLRRYMKQAREAPEAVAYRIHFLAFVCADLAGSYNERGLRRWFDRSRPQLGDKSPRMLLEGDWSPDDEGPRLVSALASEVSGAALSAVGS